MIKTKFVFFFISICFSLNCTCQSVHLASTLISLDSVLNNGRWRIQYTNTYYKNDIFQSVEFIDLIYARTNKKSAFIFSSKENAITRYYEFYDDTICQTNNISEIGPCSYLNTNPLYLERRLPSPVILPFHFPLESEHIIPLKSKNNINKESYYSDIYEFDLHKNNLVKITQQLPNNSRDVYRTERNDFKFVRLDSITFKKLFDSLKLVMVLQKNVDIQFRDFPFSDSHFITQNIFLNVRNGKQVSFQEGKFRVIDFSFLACGPCWINFRKLDTLHSEFPDLEICIIDPNYTKSDLPIIEDKLPGFIYTEPKNPNIVLDNLQQYPFTILLNPQNQIVYSHYGKLSQPAIYEIRQLLRSD